MRAAPIDPLDPSSQQATGNISEPELDSYGKWSLPLDIRGVDSMWPSEWTLNPTH
jgi:hypothetical protein